VTQCSAKTCDAWFGITHARERALGAAVIRRETPGFYIISRALYCAETRADISLHIAMHRIAGDGRIARRCTRGIDAPIG